jgi:hypothetical protein
MRRIDSPELRTLIIYTQLQRMSDQDALDYIAKYNHKISIATLGRIKKKIKNARYTVMTHLALESL